MSPFRTLLQFGAAAFSIGFTAQALAWGASGHRVVGYIADGDLGPKARIAVHQIMNNDSLSSVATWMDDIRNDPTFGKKTREWHFDDVPVCKAGPTPCKDGNCAHAQIANAISTLKGSQSHDDQLFALRVLVHLVGDIHQPLHSADNGDRGGNDVFLTNRVQCFNYKTRKPAACNLHQYWDTTLLKGTLRGITEYDYAKSLSTKFPAKDTDSKSPEEWIGESTGLAKTTVYGKLDDAACSRPGGFSTTVSATYDVEAREMIAEQLARAGHRLGALLNSIYE